jgi:site-specific recombinase XerD
MTASRYNVLARLELPMSNYVFQSERAEKMSGSAFWRMVSEAGDRTGLSVKVYAHQLRHAWDTTWLTRVTICDLSRIISATSHLRVSHLSRDNTNGT